MAKNILANFIQNKIRKGDVYVPATLLLLLKNNGQATVNQIAKLIYIFENKHSIEKYETIVRNFVSIILEEYSLVRRDGELFILNSWPLDKKDIQDLVRMCFEVSNGFFRNLPSQKAA